MRVICGKAKGCQIKSPQGLATRPTTALVRGAIFSILEGLMVPAFRVLDLYAGTGALGIEALSRGAAWVDFVEQRAKCCSLIKENLERAGLKAQARVYCCRVAKALPQLPELYDIILLDPPYADPSLTFLLTTLTSSSLVSSKSTIVVQHSSRLPLTPACGKFHLVRERKYGDTSVSIYQAGGQK